MMKVAWPTAGLAADIVIPPEEAVAQVQAYSPTPQDAGEFQKHFYFQKPGVTAEVAAADLRECRGYSSTIVLNPIMPQHLPADIENKIVTPGYGVAGVVAMGIVGPMLVRGNTAATMRKCMAFKGYSRYGVSTPLWKAINPDEAEQAILLQARLAAGPTPSTASLVP